RRATQLELLRGNLDSGSLRAHRLRRWLRVRRRILRSGEVRPGLLRPEARALSEAAPAALPAKRRLEFLDALRGLAAAYVVAYHLLLLPDPHLVAPRWAEGFALSGGTGVTL